MFYGLSMYELTMENYGKWPCFMGKLTITMETGHRKWIFPVNMVIFYSYVKLPEGTRNC